LKSSYLGNYNEYQISEAQNRNKKKEFLHMRRTFMKTNIINGMKEEINLPPVKNDRWGSFYENFILLMKNKSGVLLNNCFLSKLFSLSFLKSF